MKSKSMFTAGASRNGETRRGGGPERIHQGLGRGEQTSQTPGERRGLSTDPWTPSFLFSSARPEPAEDARSLHDTNYF